MSEPAAGLVCARCGDLLGDGRVRRFGEDRYCVGCAPAGAVAHRDLRFEAELVFVGRTLEVLSLLGLVLTALTLVIRTIAVGASGRYFPIGYGFLIGEAVVLGLLLVLGRGLRRLSFNPMARHAVIALSILGAVGCVIVAFGVGSTIPLVAAVIAIAFVILLAHPRGQRVTSPAYSRRLLAPDLEPAKAPRPFPRSVSLVVPICLPIAILMYATTISCAVR